MSALRRAWKLYKGNFGGMMLLGFICLLVTVMCFVPMIGLLTGMPWTALLTPVLYVLLILPLRQNAARVYYMLDREGVLYIPGLADPTDYGKKVGLGLRTLLCLLAWSLPFLAATGYFVYVYMGDTAVTGMDVFTIARSIMSLGGGKLMVGAKRLIMMYAATLIPLCIGLAFHCGRRHFAAMDTGMRKRGSMMLSWVTGLVCFVPFAAVSWTVIGSYVKKLIEAVSDIMSKGMQIPPLGGNVYLILGAAVVLLLPLLPLRALIIACKAHQYGDD